jgi:hypothetical protein
MRSFGCVECSLGVAGVRVSLALQYARFRPCSEKFSEPGLTRFPTKSPLFVRRLFAAIQFGGWTASVQLLALDKQAASLRIGATSGHMRPGSCLGRARRPCSLLPALIAGASLNDRHSAR